MIILGIPLVIIPPLIILELQAYEGRNGYMLNWYDMLGAMSELESHPDFLEKAAIDVDVEQKT